MRAAIIVLLIAGTHFVISRILFLFSYGIGMSQFDTGEPLSVGESIITNVSTVLDVPLLFLMDLIPAGWFPGLWGYVLFFCNSLAWGAIAYFAVAACRRSRLARRAG